MHSGGPKKIFRAQANLTTDNKFTYSYTNGLYPATDMVAHATGFERIWRLTLWLHRNGSRTAETISATVISLTIEPEPVPKVTGPWVRPWVHMYVDKLAFSIVFWRKENPSKQICSRSVPWCVKGYILTYSMIHNACLKDICEYYLSITNWRLLLKAITDIYYY